MEMCQKDKQDSVRTKTLREAQLDTEPLSRASFGNWCNLGVIPLGITPAGTTEQRGPGADPTQAFPCITSLKEEA